MFVFGLYNKLKQRVIIYRDAVGKETVILLSKSQSKFIFSSSVQAIKDNLNICLTINTDVIEFYLKNGYIRPDLSFYKEIITFVTRIFEEKLILK